MSPDWLTERLLELIYIDPKKGSGMMGNYDVWGGKEGS